MRAYMIEIQKQNLPIFIFVKTAIQSQATKLDSMHTFILWGTVVKCEIYKRGQLLKQEVS